MWWVYLSLVGVVSVGYISAVPYPHSSGFSYTDQRSYEEALFLTPILEEGNLKEARELSKVRPDIGGVESYSGYLTVNKECQSNLFFWFFPAKKYWEKAPVLLWLQGGPGASSLFGLFQEIGPFSFEKRLKEREFSWSLENNVLFVDQPVGTGFSFTEKGCYATNETQVSEELYSALVQFFQLFPEIKENKFILAGESYAGHYVPAIGYKIHQSNQHAKFKINLKGMMIGNGWMDAMYQRDTSEYMFQIGLSDFIDEDQAEENHNFSSHHLLRNSHNLNVNEFKRFDPYNYIKSGKDSLASPYVDFLELPNVRKSIHVGNQTYHDINYYVFHLLGDRDNTKIKPLVEKLLEHYPIVFYNGQLDTVCPYPLLVKFLRALNWSGAADYESASRHMWCEGAVVAGYHKSARNLHEVMVRVAGHMVPRDQPLWAFRLAHSVTNNPPNNPLGSLATC